MTLRNCAIFNSRKNTFLEIKLANHLYDLRSKSLTRAYMRSEWEQKYLTRRSISDKILVSVWRTYWPPARSEWNTNLNLPHSWPGPRSQVQCPLHGPASNSFLNNKHSVRPGDYFQQESCKKEFLCPTSAFQIYQVLCKYKFYSWVLSVYSNPKFDGVNLPIKYQFWNQNL